MACNDRKEQLVGRLYDELSEDERRELDRHLLACSDCRDELEQLATARGMLAEFRPEVPAAIPRVLVFSAPPVRRPWFAFASGFAAASLLLAVGLVAGWKFAQGGADGPTAAVPAADTTTEVARVVTPEELHAALNDYRQRMDQVSQENTRILDQFEQWQAKPVVYRDELDDQLTDFRQALDLKRASELEVVLRELFDMRVTTEGRIGETQQAVRYLMLANDPRLTEQ